MRVIKIRNLLLLGFIFKTVLYFGGAGVLYLNLERPTGTPEQQGLHTCERQVLPGYGKAQCDAIQWWCEMNVWHQNGARTLAQSIYLWILNGRVNKCGEYSRCADDLAFSLGLGTMLFCLLFLDYLRDYHRILAENAARREPGEPQPEPEREPEKHREIRAAINAELREVFGSKPQVS